jgi:hypothetical protein
MTPAESGGDDPGLGTTVRGGRLLKQRLALLAVFALLLVAAGAYGQRITVMVRDLVAADFSYYDNASKVTVKVHRIPGPDAPGQAGEGAAWPEAVLRPASRHTLNLMGLSGPEGDLWTASMRGQVLVVMATYAPVEVGVYRVASGTQESGLVVVELNAGPNGLFLMSVAQPCPDTGWFIVRIYNCIDGVHLPWGG